MGWRRLVLVGLLAVPFAGAEAAYPSYNGIGRLGPMRWSEQVGIVYARPANGSLLDTVTICKPVSGSWAGPYPAVLLIHGGAWIAGNNAIGSKYTGSSSAWCQIWASWGFVAYSVGYRLQDGSAGNAWPAQLVDVQAAVRWVRARAGGSNPERVNPYLIGAMGDSAGGSLALQVGALSAKVASPGDPVAATNPSANPQVQFVVSQFGPTHFGPSSAAAPLPDTAIARAEPANGGHGSPANSLFIQGSYDTQVVPYESRSMYCYLRAHGNPTNYLSYAGDHEYTGLRYGSFSSVVGDMVLGAISFATAAGHYARPGQTPVIPSWFAGPRTRYADATPPGC